MFLRLVLLFTLVPLADLVLLIMISRSIPLYASLLIVLGTGIVGAWLAKIQWTDVKHRISNGLNKNNVPGELITDGMLVLLAGGLLIAPGLITDAFGISLLIPVCRRWYKKRTLEYLKGQFQIKVINPMDFHADSNHYGNPDEVVDGEVVVDASKPQSSNPTGDPSSAPKSISELPTIDGNVKPDG